MKRIMLFLVTNIIVMVVGATVITVLSRYFGLDPYMSSRGLNYQSLLIICFVWGMAGSFISLAMSKFMAKMAFKLQIVDEKGQFKDLVRRVNFLAKKAGITKMPEVGIYESPEPNAFATGASKNKSLVAVSTGLLQRMNSDEVDGVLAHEIGHVANGDMVTMALVQGVVNAFVMFFARICTFLIDQALRGRDDGRGGGLGFFAYLMLNQLFHVIFGIIAAPIVYGFSRYREYRADESGARLAGKSRMIAALEALKKTYPLLQEVQAKHPTDRAVRTMQISGKLSMNELFSTHPKLDKRISRLKKLQISG